MLGSYAINANPMINPVDIIKLTKVKKLIGVYTIGLDNPALK
jgi:hypothetical protein